MTELAVLQGVRLKGRVNPVDLAATLGADLADIAPIVERLTAAGLLTEGATLRITGSGSDRLAALLTEEREGIGLFHASPRDPIWEYVLSIDQAEAGLDAQPERISLVGHSHVSLFFTRPPSTGRRSFATGAQSNDGDLLDLAEGEWLLNPGSVGQPRDGDPRAAWLELDTDEWTARYHRVTYDAAAAGAAILEAGLPSALAERLQIGR